MKFIPTNPPRTFHVGINDNIEIKDCGKVSLAPDEMVSFIDKAGNEYDVGKKEWGFYATPSINGRLVRNGYKTALVANSLNLVFIMLVDISKMDLFQEYILREQQNLVCWLDELEQNTIENN
jgi:hypothetical protein